MELKLLKALGKIAELERENRELKKRVEELEKKLKLYESPHLPSSKRILKEKEEVKPPKKRGAPPGHKGATRKQQAPDETVWLEPDCCPRCGSIMVKKEKEHKKIVEGLLIRKVVREFHWYDCRCEDCGEQFLTSSEDLPKQGRFGPTLLWLWVMLHYKGTIPFERLADLSKNCLGVEVTPAGIHNAIYRTAELFEPNFNHIKNQVANSVYDRSDETSYSFNGLKYWLWNLSTKRETLVLIRPTRSSAVLREVWGEFLDGVLNTDCYRGYDRFKAREYQKDWAHVLRDAKDLAKHDEEGRELYQLLLRMYRYIRKAKWEHREGTPRIKLWVWRSKQLIAKLAEKEHESKAVLNLALRLSKYSNHWFTCLKYSWVEPDNNSSERDIRKNVIARKILGLHRSELGLHSREIMMSTILTLERRGQNPSEFILNGIRKYNLEPTKTKS
jgi:hypothetical protein